MIRAYWFAVLGAITALAAGATGGALAEVRVSPHANVLLICVDDLRPELGCYAPQTTTRTPARIAIWPTTRTTGRLSPTCAAR